MVRGLTRRQTEQQRIAAQQQLVITQQPVPQLTTMTTTTTTAVHQRRFPIQRLIVTVVEARRLVKKDLIGKADPYVVLVRNHPLHWHSATNMLSAAVRRSKIQNELHQEHARSVLEPRL